MKRKKTAGSSNFYMDENGCSTFFRGIILNNV
jgi:hypothetical protein